MEIDMAKKIKILLAYRVLRILLEQKFLDLISITLKMR